jgi:hypothetical protein
MRGSNPLEVLYLLVVILLIVGGLAHSLCLVYDSIVIIWELPY